MDKRMTRILALLLTVCLLVSSVVFAEQAPAAELTDAELIEQYHIPNNWARPALLFAVRNGILYGSGNGTLDPENTTTRAELAAVFSRLLPTEHSADLSAFTDLDAAKWYYAPIGQAAAMGLISGTGASTMSPTGKATREQAFVMLARAFALPDADRAILYDFKDWSGVSEWAVPAVAAMIKAGYVSGSDGRIDPKKNITRQELAQVLYSIVDQICPEIPAQAEGTLLSPAEAIPAGTSVTGDLLICNDAAELVLENVTVTGRLIVRGVDPVQLTVSDCSIGELVLCRQAALTSDGTANAVTVNAGTTVLDGTYNKLTVNADTVLCGTVSSLTLNGGDLTVGENAQVNTLTVNYTADGSTVTVDGAVDRSVISADITLTGSGTVNKATVKVSDFTPELQPGTVTTNVEPTLDDLELYLTPEKMPCLEQQSVYLNLTFGGLFPEGSCCMEWYRDGRAVSASSWRLNADKSFRKLVDFPGDYFKAEPHRVDIVVRYHNQSRTYSFSVPVESAYISDVSGVKTICVPATAMCRMPVYRNSNMSGLICYIDEGTTVELLEYLYPTTDRVKLADGTVGFCEDADLHISTDRYFSDREYTTAVKEAWVNQNGYSSSTQYLLWCNLYTQEINIFKGSKGIWKLVFTTDCATGLNINPTPKQVTKILYKTSRWEYDHYYVHHVSVFDSHRGFHSMLYNYESYTLHNETMGRPASSGCVRVPDEGILYVWNNVPVNTTVVIY